MKKELPEDAERFAKIDVSFKALLKHFKGMPNCVASCAKDGLIKELEQVAEQLELCEKALADFLEAKRTIFPRFYFVSQVRGGSTSRITPHTPHTPHAPLGDAS